MPDFYQNRTSKNCESDYSANRDVSLFPAGVSPSARGRSAGWAQIGDQPRHFYRSKWERNYALYLEWLRQGGHIREWKPEPKTFWFEKIRRGVRSYLPDFLVVENDESEAFHEVKGWMDPKSKTKIARMGRYYPSVRLVVIGRKQYAAIRSKVAALVPGWEP